MKSLLATPKAHPRLFLNAGDDIALHAKIESDALLRKASENIIAMADDMVTLPPLKRELEGKRLLAVSRTCLKRMNYLSMAYRLTGDTRYVEAAEMQMLAVTKFTDWNPNHFLDVAEMTTALAIGYDWCHNALSPETRSSIRDAIIEKGLNASFESDYPWIKRKNNWNQVCHGGMIIGALAIQEDQPELAQRVIERAIENVPKAMAAYAPDGAYPEGPMYWNYGTSYNVLLIAALDSALGTDFNLSKAPGFMESADFYQQVAGPSGDFFNYCDCRQNSGVAPAMFWFATKRNDPSLLWQQQTALQSFLDHPDKANGESERFFPLLLIWTGSLENIAAPTTTHWTGEGDSPIGLHRTGWKSPNETFLGIKGGGPNAGHGHMDAGVFVMESDGVRWAEDLGMQDYHSIESKGISLWSYEGRWSILRLNNFGHNTLVVDGQLQTVKDNAHAPIIAHTADGPMPHTIVDLATIYADQLATAKRGGGLHQDGYVVIQDEIKTLDRDTEIRWAMVTHAEVSFDNDHQATLRQDGQQLTLKVLSPSPAKLEIYEIENPTNDYDAPNPGAKMIGFKVKLSASTEATLTVILQPGEAPKAVPAIAKLADW
ncbi:heparinase II/III domain-containing protein [Cerasicoccus arenae]|uniref:heparinase II/III domain-containing protein n=1 Tax=Cerasicoccus arenae TaxID=424488 RepID=UPI0016783F17|nr:heparinase II/III family protein [Cerasicoccus arenae]MBK1859183.1 heparinase II/III family protein [Cerasicoccus arenae]